MLGKKQEVRGSDLSLLLHSSDFLGSDELKLFAFCLCVEGIKLRPLSTKVVFLHQVYSCLGLSGLVAYSVSTVASIMRQGTSGPECIVAIACVMEKYDYITYDLTPQPGTIYKRSSCHFMP